MAEVELIFCKVQMFPSARKPNEMLCTWTQKTNYKEAKFNPDSFVKVQIFNEDNTLWSLTT